MKSGSTLYKSEIYIQIYLSKQVVKSAGKNLLVLTTCFILRAFGSGLFCSCDSMLFIWA